MKMNLSIVPLLLAVAIVFSGCQTSTQDDGPHRTLSTEHTAPLVVGAEVLCTDFATDPDAAERKYRGRQLEVSGPVLAMPDPMTLMIGEKKSAEDFYFVTCVLRRVAKRSLWTEVSAMRFGGKHVVVVGVLDDKMAHVAGTGPIVTMMDCKFK